MIFEILKDKTTEKCKNDTHNYSIKRLAGEQIRYRLMLIGFLIGSLLTPFLIVTQKSKAQARSTGFESESKISLSNFDLEWKVFELINRKRRLSRLTPLVWNGELASIARLHSKSMAANDFLSHIGIDGKNVKNRANTFGVGNWKMIGENIAYSRGYEHVAESIIESWMKSSGHRKILLNESWKETGVGISVAKDGTFFFTQIFLLKN